MTHQKEILLAMNGPKNSFDTDDVVVKSVDGVTFHINKGEPLGVVEESGSGKSVISLSIMRLIPMPPGEIAGGEILFAGRGSRPQDIVELQKVTQTR